MDLAILHYQVIICHLLKLLNFSRVSFCSTLFFRNHSRYLQIADMEPYEASMYSGLTLFVMIILINILGFRPCGVACGSCAAAWNTQIEHMADGILFLVFKCLGSFTYTIYIVCAFLFSYGVYGYITREIVVP